MKQSARKRILIIGERKAFRNENYYAAVEACGSEAVEPNGMKDCNVDMVKNMDGIILPGGVDVNPVLYHEENTDSRNINDLLDQYEMAVIHEAVTYRKPILGICRGHQILNVYFGGSLIQNVDRCDIHEPDPENYRDHVHSCRVQRNSFVYDVYGEEYIFTNSAHHQAVKQLGTGLVAVQFCEDDGIIEAFYHRELPILGVQWHPERMCLKNARPDTADGLPLFDYFIQHCGQQHALNFLG